MNNLYKLLENKGIIHKQENKYYCACQLREEITLELIEVQNKLQEDHEAFVEERLTVLEAVESLISCIQEQSNNTIIAKCIVSDEIKKLRGAD